MLYGDKLTRTEDTFRREGNYHGVDDEDEIEPEDEEEEKLKALDKSKC